MEHMTLEKIAGCCGGTYVGGRDFMKAEITGVFIDSRKVKEGSLFVPIRGERADGHDFIPAVFRAGALAVLSEQKLPEDTPGPYILVESTVEALGKIAGFYRRSLDVQVVGVIGSVGKTSTKEMIASVLKEKYKVHKTAGNFNTEIGLPLTIFDMTKEHEVAVLEMGISDFGEMHRLADIAYPDFCVMTNIGPCHLENLKDRDGVLKAKTEVFAHMREGGTVILNGDDDKLAAISKVNGKKPMFYGKQKGDDACALETEPLGMEGVRMKFSLRGEQREAVIPIPGEHNVYNALAAACVGAALGEGIDAICRGIASVQTISGRSNFMEKHGVTVIDDCYNANPVSMRASIDVLSKAPGRKIAVLGDMGELGEEEAALHAAIGSYVAQKGIDLLYCSGALSREMARAASDASEGKTAVSHFETKEELLAQLSPEIKKGDTLLVKASHFMEYAKLVEELLARL